MTKDLKFGTSGLRGLVEDLDDATCARYMHAFLDWMQQAHHLRPQTPILIGYDLRDSSPHIAAVIATTAQQRGFDVQNCGPLPTPALALAAQQLKAPSVMVTGSHIPADRNGLKFYRADGEIDKTDEAGILAALHDQPAPVSDMIAIKSLPVSTFARDLYIDRYRTFFAPDCLKHMTIAIYQQSSVARDLLVEIIEMLGGTALALERSDHFIPVDTEALRPQDVALAKQLAQTHQFDALISTDGDADRPLMADHLGHFVRGDVLGLFTARYLEAELVVTPVTSTSLIERAGFKKVMRCRVGSPYVIEQMQQGAQQGYHSIIGFEANGGTLVGSDFVKTNKILPALPTRDAVLPILAVLNLMAAQQKSLAQLCAELPPRFNASDRLQNISADKSAALLDHLQDPQTRQSFFAANGTIAHDDMIDGLRVVMDNGDVIHYRPSGNAPEFRCYSESNSFEQAQNLVKTYLEKAQAFFKA